MGNVIEARRESAAQPQWALLPLLAGIALFVLFASLILAAAGSTLGYDYRCYEGAARALTDGKAIYDNAFSINVGTCPGTYTYPPPFAVAVVPWLLLGDAAPVAWCLTMGGCFVLAALLLPVRLGVRALVLALGALDWPLLYAVKLGQVGPILLLLFAIAWRSIDRAERVRAASAGGEESAGSAAAPGSDETVGSAAALGSAAAFGAIVKVQPALLAVWALATRRYRAVAAAAAIAVAIVLVTLPFTGLQAWFTYADLVRSLGGTFNTAHDFAPGAVAYLAGAGNGGATLVQATATIAAALCLLAAWRYASPAISFQVTIVASQLLSAPLRDHYAALLLLPTAWLLERGRRWAAVIPLLGWIPVVASPAQPAGTAAEVATPGASWLAVSVVPLTFFACLAVLLVEAFLDARAVAAATKDGRGARRGSGE